MTGSFIVSILVAVTVVMAAALGVTTLLRRRRAATRHAFLAAAFAVALVLPVASAIAPYITIRVPVAAPAAITNAVASFGDGALSRPTNSAPPAAGAASVVPQAASVSLATVLEVIWFIGLALCLAPVGIGFFQVRTLGSRGLPWPRGRALIEALPASLSLRQRVGIILHESVSGPMTYGTLRPAIVMPVDAETWTDEELNRAIVHELEHIRRADWLTQGVARTLCAVYWFHPLVWIARRQLVLEAERASDDAVLRYSEASAYADQLVDLARRLSVGHQPVLAMANRRDLAARVHALLDGRQSRGRAGAWLVAAVSCVTAALVAVMSPIRVVAQSPRPSFDVVSVKPCDPGTGGGRGGSQIQASPGRFRAPCRAVRDLIVDAYVTFANARYNVRSAGPSFDVLHAGPRWIYSDGFTIEATTSEGTAIPVMRGPMLQGVLEDRFKLKVHREAREVPVYELVVAEGGSKLTPFEPGTCVPWDMSVSPQPLLQTGQRRCGGGSQKGPNDTWDETVEAVTLDDWASALEPWLLAQGERPLVNKTGIRGLLTFRRVYSGRWEDFAAEIKNQLGLELRPALGQREFLILDRVERPTPDATVVAPARATGPGR